jgi:hypothetical protein
MRSETSHVQKSALIESNRNYPSQIKALPFPMHPLAMKTAGYVSAQGALRQTPEKTTLGLHCASHE